MQIRTWKKEDIKPLIKLCEIMWSESKFKDIPFSEERLQKQFDYLLKNDFKGTGFVAVKDNEIIGAMVVMLSKYFFSNEIFCFDLGLFINPSNRGSIMLPIKLIKKSEEWAKSKGAIEFRPASSVGVRIEKVKKLYNFLKFDTVGNVFNKRL